MPINRIRLDDVDIRNISATTSVLNDTVEVLNNNVAGINNTINRLSDTLLTKADQNNPNLFGTVRAGSVLITNEVIENMVLVNVGAGGTVNVDLESSSIFYYQPPATANWTFNFRGSPSLSLNSYMAGSQVITATLLVTNGSTPYRATAFQIDGASATTRWADAAAPAAGNANSIDIYSFSIVKTGDAAFQNFASIARFA